MLSCKEIAEKWGVSVRAVSGMCSSGRIEGAVKIGKIWNIPENAKKPTDDRVVTGRYSKKNQNTDKMALPIGISDYIRAQAEYYYVDKTLMIKDFLDKKPLVSLFTRPRRFGKTLNMSMLDHFFSLRYNMSDFEYSDEYNVSITNYETKICFDNLVKSWFISCSSPLEDFIKALQRVDVQTMDLCLNKITQQIFSY